MDSLDLGDMFDFDGDGKTSVEEEFVAYMMFEEYQKEQSAEESNDYDLEEIEDEETEEDDDENDYLPPVRPSVYNTPRNTMLSSNVKTRDMEDKEAVVGNQVTPEVLMHSRKELIRNNGIHILFCILLCLVPVFLVFVWVTVFDMENPVAKAILILGCIVGIIWIWLCLSACWSEVKKNHEAVRKDSEQLNMHRK